ncbi:Reverse transcriptase domain-containing protein [Aphis craccivora]|uniref:Reverse transcriptase domain-containing protein n=1 Tax=Aphis craccivora TaxID=307492 RepID=A0A6G0Y434_APHCR|nr:Reverse transcriptase domain-containing protein [Aphis craccivora]
MLTSEQSKLNVLVNKQNEKLNSFERKLSDLSAQLAAIKTENNTLSNNLAALTQRVVFLETNKPSLSEDSFSDFIDRQTRSKNIILFNVPESQIDANNSDISTTNLIFQKLNVDLTETGCNPQIRKILGSSRRIKSDQSFNDVRIASDKTPKQREYFQNLCKELNERRSNGEVLVAVRSHLNSKILNITVKCIEHVFVQIKLRFNVFIICCVYIPPLSPVALHEQFFLSINELYLSNPKAKFILVGDFNLPSLGWSLYSLPLMCNSQIDSYFVSMLSHYNFNQFNLLRNHNNVILDLALSNTHITVSNDPDPLLPIDTHHPALNTSLNCDHYDTLTTVNDLIYDFNYCDYVKIVKFIGDSLSAINLKSYKINEALDRLYYILYEAINNFVPMKRIYNNSYPIWYSNSLKSLLKDKKIAHLVYKQSNNVADYINFSRLRAKCKRHSKCDHKNYIN